MALQSSGQIKMSELNTEFGLSAKKDSLVLKMLLTERLQL